MKNVNVFPIKQNDTLPALLVVIKTRGSLGEIIPFNLSGVTATTFSMEDNCGNLTISSAPAQILCASGGTIQYSWVDGDTAESGRFNGEFEMFFSGGKKLTVPTIGDIEIEIMKDINGS
jgi:hypothetical protein